MPRRSRIGCLRIPDFPIAAHRRAEGRLGAVDLKIPEVVIRGSGAHARVEVASGAARRSGIRVGMRVADARGFCAEVRERVWTPELYDELQTELAATLIAATPRVGQAGLGVFWLDPGGWDRRGGVEVFVEVVRSVALAAGYPQARIGVADTAVAARAAARFQAIVPSGDDAEFLAPLPIGVLSISDELGDLLEALGLDTVGAFAALDPADVEARLGVEGLRAHRRARGLGDAGLFGGRPDAEWVVEVELPGPVETLGPLLFLLKSCLDRLSDALAREGLCARELSVVIETEDGPVEEALRPARPTRRSPLLLALCRTALDGLRLPGRPLALRVEVTEIAAQAVEQSDLFEPPQPDPDALATSLIRLQGRWGPESVVRPAAADSHRPERTGVWEPVDLFSQDSPGAGDGAAAMGARPLPVFRLLPQPRPVEVRIEDGRPRAVGLDGSMQTVEEFVGPERISGDWWDAPYRREYYRVRTEAGGELWVYYDARRSRWFWQGWWD